MEVYSSRLISFNVSSRLLSAQLLNEVDVVIITDSTCKYNRGSYENHELFISVFSVITMHLDNVNSKVSQQ